MALKVRAVHPVIQALVRSLTELLMLVDHPFISLLGRPMVGNSEPRRGILQPQQEAVANLLQCCSSISIHKMKNVIQTSGAVAPSSIPLPNVQSPSAGAPAEVVEKKLESLCPSDATACSPSSVSCVLRLWPLAQEKMAAVKDAVAAGKMNKSEVIAAVSEIIKESLEVIQVPLHGGESITFQSNDEPT